MNQGLVQQQKLVLTAQMQHSLKILQMTIFDLQVDIVKELQENPLLEVIPDKDSLQSDFKEDIDYKKSTDYSLSDDITYNPDKLVDPLNFVIEKETLKQYLKDQLVDLSESPLILSICNYIIENVDERGYLSCSIDELAQDLETTVATVEHALKLVQCFEPDGVAARDLCECLKIQLHKKSIVDQNIYEIIDHYLDYLANNKIKKLSCILNVSVEKIQEYCNIIKTLEPKPSRGFYTGNIDQYVIPEAYIRKVDNELVIIPNDKVLPKLTVNKLYKDILSNEADSNDLEYVKSKLNSAVNLIKGIEQRNNTIYKILLLIVEKQKDYLYYGPQYLKPMIIGDIADQLDLNESTISRAIKDKYVSTPHATVKIRSLFSSGFKFCTEDDISSNSVKTQIKNLIDKENKCIPLSDEGISQILKEKGLKIARRTVAKYREELEILSSSKRKKIE